VVLTFAVDSSGTGFRFAARLIESATTQALAAIARLIPLPAQIPSIAACPHRTTPISTLTDS